MKHFIGFIFIATIFAIGMPTTEYAIPKLSPQVRENAQNFIAEKLEKCYRQCIDGNIDKYDSAAFKQDIDTSFALLDTFPSVLISSMAKQLNSCNDASAGLREKIASFRRLEDRKSICHDCLRDLFVPNLPKMERKKTEKVFAVIVFGICSPPIFRKWKEEKTKGLKEEKTKGLKVLNLVKVLRDICEFRESPCDLCATYGLLQRTTNGYAVPNFFEGLADELESDVYAQCYAECLRQSSPKIQTYHRMFLFFDKEIPETDAALFYGEEVFRAFLRYERIKRDIENKTIDNKTHLLIPRFFRLTEEIGSRCHIMTYIAELGLKEDFFKSYGSKECPNGKLPRELRDKIKRETDLIYRMRKRLEAMWNDLNALLERVGWYRDTNWWKVNFVGEKEGKKILEEIE